MELFVGYPYSFGAGPKPLVYPPGPLSSSLFLMFAPTWNHTQEEMQDQIPLHVGMEMEREDRLVRLDVPEW